MKGFMRYIYESLSPRTLVLRPGRNKVNAFGTLEAVKKVQVEFGGDRAFTLDDKWCEANGIDMETAQKEIEALGGHDIRLIGGFNEGEQVPVQTPKTPKATKVVDGPAARDNAK